MPISNPSSAVIPTSGQYSGNGGANQAIPHGLGQIPRMVIMFRTDNSATGYFHWSHDTFISGIAAGTTQSSGAVTAMDSTNFYVGDGVDAAKSANANGTDYEWVAIP